MKEQYSENWMLKSVCYVNRLYIGGITLTHSFCVLKVCVNTELFPVNINELC